ncbi:DnaA regulatory inactivator Hda [Thalassotalea sp. PLHSN55]|uniref:DnaA regulatory inactivator Hda n=1 Tax=Thalassotalea sp. PLHSN55 TaxID=3435888 RepID=UPI003F87A77F
MKNTAQLALAVQLPDDETFDSFFGETNSVVVEQLQQFIFSLQEQENLPIGFYLFGQTGSGKSHLLHACCAYAEQQGFSSLCLSFSELTQLSVDVLEGLEHIDLVCLDGIQYIADDAQWQQAVFDLYNRVIEQNKRLIITADLPAKDLGIALPDLVSRLNWGYIEQIKPLTDEEKLATIQYRAKQRGVVLSDEVAKYLLNHFSRQMQDLISSLDVLDKASIREQRKITIPFIKEVLSN